MNIPIRKFPLCGMFVLAATIKSEEIQKMSKLHPWTGDNTQSKWECGYITISLKIIIVTRSMWITLKWVCGYIAISLQTVIVTKSMWLTLFKCDVDVLILSHE